MGRNTYDISTNRGPIKATHSSYLKRRLADLTGAHVDLSYTHEKLSDEDDAQEDDYLVHRVLRHRFIFLWLPRVERIARNFCRVFAFMIVLCFRGVFEGARRNGTIRLAQSNHFRGEKHNCLLPLPPSWCYACCVCCASCVFRSGASESASGSLPTRSTRSAGAKCFTPIIPPPIFFLPCFHPCTLPHTCTGSQCN